MNKKSVFLIGCFVGGFIVIIFILTIAVASFGLLYLSKLCTAAKLEIPSTELFPGKYHKKRPATLHTFVSGIPVKKVSCLKKEKLLVACGTIRIKTKNLEVCEKTEKSWK